MRLVHVLITNVSSEGSDKPVQSQPQTLLEEMIKIKAHFLVSSTT